MRAGVEGESRKGIIMRSARRLWTAAAAVGVALGVVRTAGAADVVVQIWEFSFEDRTLTFSATCGNTNQAGTSAALRLRMVAVSTITGDEYLLSQIHVAPLAAGAQQTFTHTQTFEQIPPDGLYVVSIVLDEAEGEDYVERHRVAAEEMLEVTVAAQEAAIRRQAASTAPCGAMIMPASLATLACLCFVRIVQRRR